MGETAGGGLTPDTRRRISFLEGDERRAFGASQLKALQTIANIPPVPVNEAVEAGEVWKKLNFAIATARKALQ